MSDYTFKEYYQAFQRATFNNLRCLRPAEGGLYPSNIIKCAKYKFNKYLENPHLFKPSGLLTFHGRQGSGKTLTAAAVYTHQILERYPMAILVTNTRLKDRPFNAYVFHQELSDEELRTRYKKVIDSRKKSHYLKIIEELENDFLQIQYPNVTLEQYIDAHIGFYPFDQIEDFDIFSQSEQYQIRDILTDELITSERILAGDFKKVTIQYTGLDCLKYVNNGVYGVLFFIDEIHLELNSLQSRNISMEIIVEVSQLRKQLKHIVGSSQALGRIAKPVREQLKDIVSCKCLFGCIQYNHITNVDHLYEDSNGHIDYDILHRNLFFHNPFYYEYYDTYAKMRRYNNEWQGRPQLSIFEGEILHE